MCKCMSAESVLSSTRTSITSPEETIIALLNVFLFHENCSFWKLTCGRPHDLDWCEWNSRRLSKISCTSMFGRVRCSTKTEKKKKKALLENFRDLSRWPTCELQFLRHCLKLEKINETLSLLRVHTRTYHSKLRIFSLLFVSRF